MTATIHRLKPRIDEDHLECPKCHATTDLKCNCGVDYIYITEDERRARKIKDAIDANPNTTDRQIAKDVGVSHPTVSAHRKANGKSSYHNTERQEASGRKARGRKPGTKVVSQRDRVLELFKRRPKGLTTTAAQAEFPDVIPHTVTTSISRLLADGILMDSGKRVQPNGRRRKVTVYCYDKDHDKIRVPEMADWEREEQEEHKNEIKPELQYHAFLIRADQAYQWAFFPKSQRLTERQRKDIISWCLRIETQWKAIRQQVEGERRK